MIKEDIYALEQILSGEKQKNINNAILSSSFFWNYSNLYSLTNEDLETFFPKQLNNKKILTPTASGSQILYSINNGATDITAYDINNFAKYYAKLIISMIIKYDFNIFCSSFYNIIHTYENSNKNSYQITLDEYAKLIDNNKYIDNETYLFWETFIKYQEKDYSSGTKLFYPNLGFYPPFLAEEKTYNKLKCKLQNSDIKYIDCDLTNLYHILDNKYDIVYVSNILEYMNKEKRINTINDLTNIIEDDGYIMAYLFNELEMGNLSENEKFDMKVLGKKYHTTCKFYKKTIKINTFGTNKI